MSQIDDEGLFWQKAHDSFAANRLELTILPTEQCNFRCTYCYEDFAVGRMDPSVVAATKSLVQARAGELTELHLRWFGGEPMLALDIIEDIGSLAVHLAGDGIAYTSSITTNGSMLSLDRARRLTDVGVTHFQVSLDGPRQLHDTTRLTRTGNGSYDKIHQNLAALRDSDLAFTVEFRLHLTPANVPHMDRFVAEVRDWYLRDSRFTAEFFPIENLGGPHDGEFEVLDHDEALAAVARLRRIATPAAETVGQVGGHYVCYAAKANAFVIRASGRVAKCTAALTDPRNELGTLLANGELHLDPDRVAPWLVGWEQGDWDVLRCPLDVLPQLESAQKAALPMFVWTPAENLDGRAVSVR